MYIYNIYIICKRSPLLSPNPGMLAAAHAKTNLEYCELKLYSHLVHETCLLLRTSP